MNEILRRRRGLYEKKELENNLVTSFNEQTLSFSQYTNINVPLKEAIVKGNTYRVVLDGTVSSGYMFLVLLGAQNNTITYYPDGQDGEVTKTWKVAQSGNATTANAWIYCRPISGTGTVTATVRNIKIYLEE